MSSVSDVVVLRNGVAVLLAPWRLALALEARGCLLRLDGTDLLIEPGALLTDGDRAAIRMWREDLKRIVGYCADSSESGCPQ
jgi:hypothetical protein